MPAPIVRAPANRTHSGAAQQALASQALERLSVKTRPPVKPVPVDVVVDLDVHLDGDGVSWRSTPPLPGAVAVENPRRRRQRQRVKVDEVATC